MPPKADMVARRALEAAAAARQAEKKKRPVSISTKKDQVRASSTGAEVYPGQITTGHSGGHPPGRGSYC